MSEDRKIMTINDWVDLNFTPCEMGAEDMDYELMMKLQGMREYAGVPIKINSGYSTSGHSTKSQHYVKRAADIVLVGLSLLEQYTLAERFNFGGLGVYPYWNTPGLHVDTRPISLGSKANRWWRDSENNYHGIQAKHLVVWGTMKV